MRYRYDVARGVTITKFKTKKYIVTGLATLGIVSAMAVPAMAAGPSDGSNASSCGAIHGAFADSNGNFGYIGQTYQGAPNLHGGIMGQDPGATGYNNSHTDCQQ